MHLKSLFTRIVAGIPLLSLLTSTSIALAQVAIDNGETVTVPGPAHGGSWSVGTYLLVGDSGTGTLEIFNNGYVSSQGGSHIGFQPGSTGIVTVSGDNATWYNAGQLLVGDHGTGTLTITNGGYVLSMDGSFIGGSNSTPGGVGSVTVSGADSLGIRSNWVNTDFLIVGSDGGIGTLTIADRGIVSNTEGRIGTANSVGSVTVSGANSVWYNSTQLRVGSAGSGTLAITDDGTVLNTDGYIGYIAGSVGKVTVSGVGSQWTNSNQLYVGNSGSGTLAITDGGTVSNIDGYIGYNSGSTGEVTVSGAGSQWINSGNLFINSGSLAIINGGTVSSDASASIGFIPGSVGSVKVSGTGSQLNNSGDLVVGENGTGTLTIADGGHVSTIATILGSFGSGTLLIGAPEGATPLVPGTLTTPVLLFGPGQGRIVFNHTSTDYVFDATLNGGANNVAGSYTGLIGNGLIETLAGRTIFNADQGDFTGTLQMSSAGILQINSNMSSATANILVGGTLEGNGIVGNTTNAGAIAPGTSIGTLTIAGNYTGNTGLLHIESQLEDDNSPTDHLVITGNANGNTAVKVTNLGGLGAQTINGINLIKVGGLAEDDTFLLAGDYVTAEGQQAVIGGAYAYTLHANGNAATAGRDWYLSSALANPQEPQEPQEPDGNSGPRYQAGVPLYEQYPQVLASLNTLPTLQQRVGNRYWSSGVLSVRNSGGSDEGQWAWGRIEGRHQVTDPASSTSNSSRDIDVWKLQTGIDVPLHQGQDGSLLTGGVNFTYGKANADISSYFGYGSIDTSAYGLGATLTWYGNEGVYVDGQVQTLWFDSDLYSSTEGHSVANGNNGRGYATSVETGKRYSLDDGLSLTPQVQLTYSRVDFDSFNDPYDSQVSLEDGDSLRARAGVVLDKETAWTAKDGTTSRTHLYTNLDLYNEFLNGTKTQVSGVDFSTRDERQSVGIGAGATQEWQNGRYAVYGNINLLTATRNVGDNYAVGGTVGLRIRW